MGDVVDLERFRRRIAPETPTRPRIPRPYRYDPGPLAGKRCDRPRGSEEPGSLADADTTAPDRPRR
jgi:hypothetical protein